MLPLVYEDGKMSKDKKIVSALKKYCQICISSRDDGSLLLPLPYEISFETAAHFISCSGSFVKRYRSEAEQIR